MHGGGSRVDQWQTTEYAAGALIIRLRPADYGGQVRQTSAGLDTVSVDGDNFFLKLSDARLICLSSPAARAGAAAGLRRCKSA